MTMTSGPATPAVRRSALDRDTAMRLAETEYRRYGDQLRGLSDADWSLPTDCPAWDVRQMAAHNLGMAEMAVRMPEMLRQNVKAQLRQRRRGGPVIDCLTALQVEERVGLNSAEIVERYAAAGPRAVRGRRRRPALLRSAPMPGRETVAGVPERWAWGFVFDTILTRDTWMHRVDTSRATGRELELTSDHDGVLVADVVAEWAQRHGAPCTLELTGPAGGHWSFGTGGPEIGCDAVEFCRILSRRARGEGLLDEEVPF